MLNKQTGLATLTALGIVYGDIGTSPLYAFRSSLLGLPLETSSLFGALSLIFWSLILVISFRYLMIFLNADNKGEGGILAMLALLKKQNRSWYLIFFTISVFGAGLLFSDGILTPAISVTSAIEGLTVVAPKLDHLILPITLILLLILFMTQRMGTQRIGFLFGPLILTWFFFIGALGFKAILEYPAILKAMNPYYAISFFNHYKLHAYLALGGIFLVITGAEALYADLGHFGKTPIRLGWFLIVLPALLLNYFGQGAEVMLHPENITNPFYLLAPPKLALILLIIATAATIIASQAIISASFSLAKQAMLLDLCPKLRVIHTSIKAKGQIYIPTINTLLAIGTLSLVSYFKTSEALASAYGLAVNLEMFIISLLVMYVARQYWEWSLEKIIAIFFLFTCVDLAYLGANLHKFFDGGFIPFTIALIIQILMLSWRTGIQTLQSLYYKNKTALQDILDQLSFAKLNRVPEFTAIFVTDPHDQGGGGFLHYLKLNHIMPEHILIVSIAIQPIPYVTDKASYELSTLKSGIYRLTLYFGFMESIDLPDALDNISKMGQLPFQLDLNHATFLVELIHISITDQGWQKWQKRLFAVLFRNALQQADFFALPQNKTISIGTYCEM